MKKNKDYRPSTKAAQGLGWTCPTTGAVIPPLHLSTTFARDANYEKPDDRGYARDDSPAIEQAEAVLADLEGGADAITFATGMAACSAPFQCLLPGDHVVCPDELYFGLPKWLAEFPVRWGLEVTRVPAGDIDAIRAAIRPGSTRMVWIETPANPTWTVTDISAAAEAAHAAGAILTVDSTAATPVLTQPIRLGADLVVHSATKFLNGHSDVLAGVLVTAAGTDFWQRICDHRFLSGPMLGAFEAYLLTRGLRTLYLRVERQCASAMKIAKHFADHPKIEGVLYPGLPTHPNHDVAARQMQGGFGGMLSLLVAGGADGALDLVKAVRLFKRATSLGGVESLIEHRATVEGGETATPENLLRLSIGIEDVGDLIEDLETALAAVRA